MPKLVKYWKLKYFQWFGRMFPCNAILMHYNAKKSERFVATHLYEARLSSTGNIWGNENVEQCNSMQYNVMQISSTFNWEHLRKWKCNAWWAAAAGAWKGSKVGTKSVMAVATLGSVNLDFSHSPIVFLPLFNCISLLVQLYFFQLSTLFLSIFFFISFTW